MLRTYHLPVDVTCGACTPHVEKLIRDTGLAIQGDIKTDIISKISIVTVKVDPDIEDKTEAILRTALDDGCRLRDDSSTAADAPPPQPASQSTIAPISNQEPIAAAIQPPATLSTNKPRWLSWVLGSIGIISGIAMMTIMLSVSAIPFSIMAAMGIFSAALSLALGGTTIYNGIKQAKHGSYNMDTLYALAGVVAIIATIAHLFLPGFFPMLFDAALMIFGFKHIGDAIKELATRQNARDKSFSERTKSTVIIEPSGERVALDKIAIGTIIKIPRDSIIPIDGIILDENAYLYETLLNGEDEVKLYTVGKEALSGFRVAGDNINPFVRIQTTRSVQDSNLSQLDKRLSIEKQQKPPIITTTEKILDWFIPVVVIFAFATAAILGAAFLPMLGAAGAFALSINCLISILVSACPCALGLAAPLAINAGATKAENKQIAFNKYDTLQTAAQLNVAVVDMYGTLTMGKPIVKSFHTTENSQHILSAAMALESHSRHSFAKTINEYAANKLSRPNITTAEKAVVSRLGVSGHINGKKMMIGNEILMSNHHLDAKKYLLENNIAIKDTQQVSYIATDEAIVGHFVLEDPPRPGAREFIDYLNSEGWEVVLCTGSGEIVANAHAKEFGIKHVYANCKNIANKSDDPTIVTKFSVVKLFQTPGKHVVMIGDAGNDAVAMASSHYAVAVKSSASDEICLDIADVVIENDSLLPLVALFETAKQTSSNIKQNVIGSLSFNTLSIAAAVAGTALAALGFITALPVVFGAGLMVLLLLPIIANVARLKSQALPHYDSAKIQADINEHIGSTTAGLREQMPSVVRQNNYAKPNTVPLADARGSDQEADMYRGVMELSDLRHTGQQANSPSIKKK